MHTARADAARQQPINSATETERDPETQLN